MRAILFTLGLMSIAATASELDGVVQWSRRTELTLPVSGVVAAVPVSAGERVVKDAVLLTLDPAPFKSAVRTAEAQVTEHRTRRDEAARDARVAQELYDRTVLSTVELENARNKQVRAEAGLKEAGAALDQARYRQRVSSLRAPFDAIVLSRQAEVGQSIAAELRPPVLFVIAAAGEYVVQARLSPDQAQAIKVGQAANVRVGGKSYPATLRSIAHDPVNGKESYLLDAAFASPERQTAGRSAQILLP